MPVTEDLRQPREQTPRGGTTVTRSCTVKNADIEVAADPVAFQNTHRDFPAALAIPLPTPLVVPRGVVEQMQVADD